MPKNKKRSSKTTKSGSTLNKTIKDYLLYGTEPAECTPADQLQLERFFAGGADKIKETWRQHRDLLLLDWVKEHPCTRPWLWWTHEAPLEPVKGWPSGQSAQRQRLSGTGTPRYEVLNIAPHFDKGIPDSWVNQWDVDYYSGQAKDIHGNPIVMGNKENHFKGQAIDKLNPPIFESEAVYLERLGLLTEAEKLYLTEHPELLEPEKIETDNL